MAVLQRFESAEAQPKGLRLSHLLPRSLLLLLALVLLRLQVATDLDLSLPAAVSLSMPAGVVYDLVAVMIAGAAALGAGALSPAAGTAAWILIAALIYLAALANLLYFRFFGGMLEWWVVRFHLSDVGAVGTSAIELALRPAIVSSVIVAAGALVLAIADLRSPRLERSRPVLMAQAAGLVAVAVMTRELPGPVGLYGGRDGNDMLRENVLQVWIRDAAARIADDGTDWSWRAQIWRAREDPGRLDSENAGWALTRLSRYRTFREADGSSPPSQHSGALVSPAAFQDGARVGGAAGLGEDPAGIMALRERLGLSSAEPPNVIVVFVESMRAFELLSPELSPQAFPGIGRVVRRHGILFRQAYSSALEAGQSVRGRFSTLCSMLPNLDGAATYLAYPLVEVPCLAKLFREKGYRTVWLTSAAATYHNASIFEKAHGTDLFIDEVFFLNRGIRERVGDWGLADLPVLESMVGVLEAEARRGPLFAALTTISSHFPMSVVPEGPLSEELAVATADRPDYQGYLSRMIYEDRALAHFFSLFFESDLSKNTLVVLLGDHSLRMRPHLELGPVQEVETYFRIPIALVSARLRDPFEVAHPVHQVDIAPTVARLAGVEVPETWMGRGLFATPASPWVYVQGATVHYRTELRSCYTLPGASKLHCVATGESDPMFESDLRQLPEDQDMTRFFAELGPAMRRVISGDLLATRE